jgi:nucleoside 2-deoxyribosyltransferase
MTTQERFSIYFAGELFSLKHLAGNALLADEIDNHPKSQYQCELPQDHEAREMHPLELRNQDLLILLNCDVGLFHFDGSELDSGTIVEYLFAKMLDIPSVVLRTDFRAGGDSYEPWNLMLSGFPRVETILVHGMVSYRQARQSAEVSRSQAAVNASRELAGQVIEALDRVRALPPIISRAEQTAVYSWARRFPGSGFDQCVSEQELTKIIERKRAKGML